MITENAKETKKKPDIFDHLREYCKQVGYGTIIGEIKVHQGLGREFIEMDTKRKFKV